MDDKADSPSSVDNHVPLTPDNAPHAEGPGMVRDTVASLDLRQPGAPPWNWSDIVLIAITAAFSSFLAMAAFYLIRARHGGVNLKALASDVWVLVPAQILGYAITFLLMYLLVTQLYGLPFWRGIKWGWPRPAVKVLLFPCLGAALAIGLGLLQQLLPMPKHVPFDRLFTTLAAIHLMAVFGILVAPFMEELFFRGFLYPVIECGGKPVIVLGIATTFAGVYVGQHGFWSAVLLMFLLGLTIGFLVPLLERGGWPVLGTVAALVVVGTAAAFAVVHHSEHGWTWSVVLPIFLFGLTVGFVLGRGRKPVAGLYTAAALALLGIAAASWVVYRSQHRWPWSAVLLLFLFGVTLIIRFLFPVLERGGRLVAVLGTAAAFAVVHGGQYGWAWSAVLLMFMVGLTLTIARAWTGSVAPGFLIHVGYNLTLFVVMYMATDHFQHLDKL